MGACSLANGGSLRAPAGASLLAAVALVAPVLALSSCWVDGFSWERCCGERHGPTGNAQCWDSVFRYDPCCTQPDTVAPAPAATLDGGALEQQLGPKLDAVLAENNSTLAELEAELRDAVRSPERRSMAGPMSRAFLALALLRQGRAAEAAEEIGALSGGDFSISSSGAWVGAAAEGYHMHDEPFSEALVAFLRGRGAQTVADFGCGLGLYVRDLRAAGFRAGGFDGNPSTAEITSRRCQHLDLSHPFDLGTRWDWVLSLEVAEHIPPEFEAAFVENLDSHARAGLVLSWGNQAGQGHVNVRERAEVEALFRARGFRVEAASAAALREVARLPWLKETVLVLEREVPPGPPPRTGKT